jgi:hypothetical protein
MGVPRSERYGGRKLGPADVEMSTSSTDRTRARA